MALLARTEGRTGRAVRARPTVASSTPTQDHPTRQRIVDYLRALPGDHFRSIARNLGLSVGETRHHLNALIRNGAVVERKDHARSRYYPRDEHGDADRNELFLRHWVYRDLRMRALMKVRSEDSVSATQVARQLGVSRQRATYHLERLIELGLIQREAGRYQAIPAAHPDRAMGPVPRLAPGRVVSPGPGRPPRGQEDTHARED